MDLRDGIEEKKSMIWGALCVMVCIALSNRCMVGGAWTVDDYDDHSYWNNDKRLIKMNDIFM